MNKYAWHLIIIMWKNAKRLLWQMRACEILYLFIPDFSS